MTKIFNRTTWAGALYALIDLPWAITAFTLIFTLLAVGASLTIIYVGIPILMFATLLARWFAQAQVGLARGIIGWGLEPIAARKPAQQPGLWGTVRASLTDSVAWRSLGYFSVKLFLAPLNFAIASLLLGGLGTITYPIWRPFLPAQMGADGNWHRGTMLWNGTFINTWQSMTAFALVGVALALGALLLLRAVLNLERGLLSRAFTTNATPAALHS